jgi:hypothetical protein
MRPAEAQGRTRADPRHAEGSRVSMTSVPVPPVVVNVTSRTWRLMWLKSNYVTMWGTVACA